MYQNKKIWAVIPARAGSKGLPGKNIKVLHHKPLIAWSIDEAWKSRYIDDVIVSTDDEKIAGIAKHYKARVPFLRPARFARDDSSLVDVFVDLFDQLEKKGESLPEFTILLQPTSPLRTADDIDQAFEMLVSNKKALAVVGVTNVREYPYWMKKMDKERFIEDYISDQKHADRRQDLPELYKPNGSLFILKTSTLLNEKTFYPPKSLGYLMPKERSVDIDENLDFQLAELILSRN